MSSCTVPSKHWWRHGVCYQIWPTSFATSPTTKPPIGTSPTGTSGSIRGIIEKIPYIKSLGCDYIWMSPCYASPLEDQGYDISDYESIHPSYGTVSDIDELTHKLHALDMRIILDLVINHTSDQHKWFQESQKSTNNEYSDYYHWREPRYTRSKSDPAKLIRQPPNQWACFFGGSAWTYSPTRKKYYLHLFLASQPDLNWAHAPARASIYATSIAFWLKHGINGFRIDVCNLYSKTFPEVPEAEQPSSFTPEELASAIPVEDAGEDEQQECVFSLPGYVNGPEMHPYLREIREQMTADFGPEIMFVAEMGGCSYEQYLKYLNPTSKPEEREIDMYFDFGLHTGPSTWIGAGEGSGAGEWNQSGLKDLEMVDQPAAKSWSQGRTSHPVSDLHAGLSVKERMPTPPLPLAYIRQAAMKTQSYIDPVRNDGADRWAALWLENHDMPRSISRFGYIPKTTESVGTQDARKEQELAIRSGKLLAMFQCTLSGSLFLYQGQEIGMGNIPIPVFEPDSRSGRTGEERDWTLDDLRDVWFKRRLAPIEQKYKNRTDNEAVQALRQAWSGFWVGGRDNARTPMQWTDITFTNSSPHTSQNTDANTGTHTDAADPNAGFCSAESTPWMRINKTPGDGISVAEQTDQKDSLLEFWREALKLRKAYSNVWTYGNARFVDNGNQAVLSYVKQRMDKKETSEERHLIVLNFSDSPSRLPDVSEELGTDAYKGRLVFGNHLSNGSVRHDSELEAWEGRVYELQ